MKKLVIASIASAALLMGLSACAETASGKVVKTNGNLVTIQDSSGSQHTMQTTPDTTYRKRVKSSSEHKNHLGHNKARQPILVEDDYVDIIYYPASDTEWIIEDIVIYEK
ncbi:MAG: hypothetical protein SPL08_05000 [Pseudomonadota bacterium]|nr:hypothetical protein [Pseudomonadota bacterium]